MTEFETLWKYLRDRKQFAIVQDYNELEYAWNLVKGVNPKSYLEIGTAAGDSLYAFGSLLPEDGRIHWIDLAEAFCKKPRDQSVASLSPRAITHYAGRSADEAAVWSTKGQRFDVVYIDGGHDYEEVLSDCHCYAPLADKLVLWHDVQMPAVRQAIQDWLSSNPRAQKKFRTYTNSETMGYGILEVER